MAFSLTDILGGSLGTAFKDIVSQFHMSPEDKAKFQAEIDANAAALAVKQIEYQQKLEDSYQVELTTASANIRAEASSGDKYTSRARPSFIYVMLLILTANFIVFPLLGKPALNFPDALFWLFGSCMLGYTGARTWEKVQATQAGQTQPGKTG
jgi:Holin of 3TMs, for gene-transfer release